MATPPMNPMSARRRLVLRAEIALVTATLFWSTTFSVTKPLVEPGDPAVHPVGPFVLMALRTAVGALTIWIYVVLARHRPTEHLSGLSERSRAGLAAVVRAYAVPCTLLGALTFVGFASQTVGLQYTTASKSALITGLSVVLVPLLVPFILRKLPGGKVLVAALVSFVGTGFLTIVSSGDLTASESVFGLGEVLTLVCAIDFAFQIVLTEWLTIRYDVMRLSVGALSIAALFSAAFTLFYPGEVWELTWRHVAGGVYLGVTGTGICFAIATWAQRHVKASRAAIIFGLEPFFGSLFAILFLSERFTNPMLFGAALIFLGIWLSRPHPGEPTPLEAFLRREW